ncbi:MAG TPA: porin [bacterium]|nr:porin [bacterium]
MKFRVRFSLCILAVLAWAAPALWAQDPSQGSVSDQIQALQDQNQSLQQRLQALEDKVNAAPAAQDQSAASPAGLQDVYTPLDEGSEYINSESRHFVLSDRTGKDQLRFGGYLFSELALNDQAPGYEPGVNGFLARKAHLDFGGRFDDLVGMSIGIESDKSTAVSIGFFHAYVYVKFDKALEFQAGKFTNALSLEGLQPSADLPFVESSMLANLIPDKDIGAMISGEVDHWADYALEVANGEQDNESSATGPGKAAQDFKAVTARVFLTPFKHSHDEGLKGLGLGLAGILDNEVNQDNAPWQKLETSFGGNAFMTYNGSVVARGDFYHWDAQGYYYNGPFGFLGEYVQSIQTVGVPGKPSVQLTNIGWLAEATFVLGGEAGYEGVKVDQPFDPARGQWGAFEFAARLHSNLIDVNSFTVGFPYDPLGGSLGQGAEVATAYGLGVNWWLDNHFKWMIDAERTEFSGGNLAVLPEQAAVVRATLIL